MILGPRLQSLCPKWLTISSIALVKIWEEDVAPSPNSAAPVEKLP